MFLVYAQHVCDESHQVIEIAASAAKWLKCNIINVYDVLKFDLVIRCAFSAL